MNRVPLIVALAALWLLSAVATPASAQLMDVGAASAIRADMEAKNTRNTLKKAGAKPGDKQDEQEADADADADGEQDAEESDAGDENIAAPVAPKIKFDKWDDSHSIYRSTTGYASWLFVLLMVLAFFFWIRVGDWINRDAQEFELGHETWNPIVLLAGLVAFLTVFFLPFAAAFPAMLLAGVVPMVAYALRHNAAVESHQKVFTRDWLRYQMGELLSGVGLKVKSEKEAAYAKGAAVDFTARGGKDATVDKANLLTARQSPGYVLAKELVSQMVKRRSDQVMLDYRSDTVAVKHYVDGVWHNGDALEREDGDVMLAVVKQLANLDPKQRQKQQEGEIGAEYAGTAYDIGVTSQGVKTGERVIVSLVDPKKKSLSTFTDLGMREKISSQYGEALAADKGIIVISAQPGAGLTTLCDVSLMETDRLMRDFFSVEDAGAPERDIENIVVHTYDGSKGEKPASIMEKLVRLYPNAYVCRDISDPASAKALIDEVKEGKLLATTVNASEATEAMLRVLKNKAPHRDFSENVTASINMRLIRLLCPDCRVGYEPSADLLKKLGIPAGKVTELYRVPNEEEVKKPCESCNGIGYKGRTGLFELLIVNDKTREVLLKQPKLDLLKKAARTAHMRNHQEEGILLVAKGATSLQELQRVLKG